MLSASRSRLAQIFTFLAAVVFLTCRGDYAEAAIFHTPSVEYPDSAKRNYSWFVQSNRAQLAIDARGDTEKFMDEESIRRYVKLRMRNFLKDYELVESQKGYKHDFMNVLVELYKYNDKVEIYTGMFAVKVESALSQGGVTEPFIMSIGLSGADTQVVG